MQLPASVRNPKQKSPNRHHNATLLCYNTPCPLFIGHKLLHATIRSTFPLLPTIIIRSTKVHHLKSTAIPVPSIAYNQASPPTACTNHRQPTGLLSCFILFPDSTALSACAFSSGNSIISLDTPFPPASAQSGTAPPP